MVVRLRLGNLRIWARFTWRLVLCVLFRLVVCWKVVVPLWVGVLRLGVVLMLNR